MLDDCVLYCDATAEVRAPGCAHSPLKSAAGMDFAGNGKIKF
jgi:hypothetical protein